jgi:hypothetical protein
MATKKASKKLKKTKKLVHTKNLASDNFFRAQ